MSLLHEQRHFFSSLAPFERLPVAARERALSAMDVVYFPKDRVIFLAGEEPHQLFVIIKGGVREEDEDGIVAFHGPEELFDGRALLAGQLFNTFTTVEETICYSLPRTLFLDLAREFPPFQDFFCQGLGRKMAFMDEQESGRTVTPLMTARIKDCDLRPPLSITAELSLHEAAVLMKEKKADALLVVNQGKTGIVTGTDIRNAVAVEGRPLESAVGEISAWSLTTVQSDDLLFNALLLMARRGLSRLVVRDGGKTVGFLELSDLVGFLHNQAILIMGRIERADSLEELKEANDRLIPMIQALHGKGVKIRYIARLVRELDRRLLQKVFSLLAPPDLQQNSCLVVMGSEGRGEQILKTDQDNALILRNGFSWSGLSSFGRQFTDTLILLGYPPCPGNTMVCNPLWSSTVEVYQQIFGAWFQRAEPPDLMQLATFYDARVVAGDKELFREVKSFFLRSIPQDNKGFFAHFARPTVAFETPLGLFSRFVVEKEGEKQGLDIKKGGIFPIVHGIRTLALEQRLRETNTGKRLAMLTKLGILDQEFADELIVAFEFMTGLRLQHRLEQMALGHEENNYIDPQNLNRMEQDLLKDSLKVVNRLKKMVHFHYRLDMVE